MKTAVIPLPVPDGWAGYVRILNSGISFDGVPTIQNGADVDRHLLPLVQTLI